MDNTTIANIAEKIILKDIILTGDTHGFNESHFCNTVSKYAICAIFYVMRDKKPITLDSVCGVLAEHGLKDIAQELRGIVGGSV
jgi:hypothetical protein